MRIAYALVVLIGLAGPALADDPVVVKTIISTTMTAAGQPLVLPQGPVQLTVSTYDIAPGAQLGVHRHPYPRYAYVTAGTLTVINAETAGAETVYPAGSVIVEMVGIWHYGVNRGSEPVHLIVVDQTPPGEASTVLKPQ